MKPLAQQFQDDIALVIDRYRNEGLTFGEAIGVLEIVKLDLWSDQSEDAAEDYLL
jgi:hypothetical protein